jgi:hypothetical protein
VGIEILIYVAVGVGVIAYVFRPLFVERGEVERTSNREMRRQELVEKREQVLEAIREIDFDHKMGKLEGDDYKETRGRYEAQAVDLINKLDQGNAATPAGKGSRTGEIEDLVEQEIASARKKR